MRSSTANRWLHAPGIAATLTLGACAPVPIGTVRLVDGDTVEFPATVQSSAFTQGDTPGYHLVVWRGGRATDHALFLAGVDDVQVVDALESLGAAPGDALTIDTWERRHDSEDTAPDRTIEGPRVELEFSVPGTQRPLSLDEVLDDVGDRGFDMRFGGHRANIAAWHSGCVVCLYSCPGSKVGNAAYTVRDFVAGGPHFRVRPGVLPVDGSEVTVRLRLVEGGAS
ncbi:MAG TPA: YdjY domain-containing protein [Acidobacteriota bacterium]|nr:YdjY domain-containing protein [Acidobacteriota bacterium]